MANNKMKWCELGRHSTPLLFWRKGTPKNTEGLSACANCAAKYMLQENKPNNAKQNKRVGEVKISKRIKPVSDKMKVAQRAYMLVRNEYLNKNKMCEFKGCLKSATEVHHIRGRGKFLTDTNEFMAICAEHHRWIHEHDAEARDLGYLKSRL